MNLKCTKWILMQVKIILNFLGQTTSFLEPCSVIQNINFEVCFSLSLRDKEKQLV